MKPGSAAATNNVHARFPSVAICSNATIPFGAGSTDERYCDNPERKSHKLRTALEQSATAFDVVRNTFAGMDFQPAPDKAPCHSSQPVCGIASTPKQRKCLQPNNVSIDTGSRANRHGGRERSQLAACRAGLRRADRSRPDRSKYEAGTSASTELVPMQYQPSEAQNVTRYQAKIESEFVSYLRPMPKRSRVDPRADRFWIKLLSPGHYLNSTWERERNGS